MSIEAVKHIIATIFSAQNALRELANIIHAPKLFLKIEILSQKNA